MNAPFLRMLWKEYRSLRLLWAGVTLGTLALWGVILISLSRVPQHHFDIAAMAWVFALWMPPIYLLACTSAQFSGEQEERTAGWLVNLGASFRPTLSAKLLWTAATTLLMHAILFGAAWQIRVLINSWHETGGPLIGDERFLGTTEFATFLLLESLVWGVFWSLQTSSVMRALLISAATVVVINFFTAMLWMPVGGTWQHFFANAVGPWGFLRTGLTFAVLVADYVLARRWLAGRGWDWSIPWNYIAARRPAAVRKTAVEPATPWSRAWQRLRWLEWQRLRGFGLACFGLCLFCVGCFLAFVLAFPPTRDISPPVLPSLLAFLMPLVTGLAAWQGEQTRGQFRFLVNRGISPIGLWWNKFGVWFAACIASSLLFLLVEGLEWAAKLAFWSERSSIPTLMRISQYWQHGPYRLIEPMQFIWIGVTLFVGVFTVGLYFRRAIYAVAVGLFLFAAVNWLLAVNVLLGLPAWLGIVPVLLWLLWCGLRQLPRWSLERTGWRTAAVIAAEWLVFPLVFTAALTAYWVYSVPKPDVGQIMSQAIANRIVPQYKVRQSQIGGMGFAGWAETFQAADEVLQTTVELYKTRGGDAPTTDEIRLAQEPAARRLRDSMLQPNLLPQTPGFSASPTGLQAMFFLEVLLRQADQSLASGQTADSIAYLRAAVRLGGAAVAELPLDSASHSARNQMHAVLHQRLVDWAQRPQQNSEVVRDALAELIQFDLYFWHASDLALQTDYQRMLREIDKARKDLKWNYPPWEAERNRRLTTCAFSNRAAYLQNPMLQQIGMMSFGFLQQQDSARDRAWAFREAQQRLEPASQPVGIDGAFLHWTQNLDIRMRCTLGSMAVVAFRQAHWRLPVSFEELSPEFGPPHFWQLPQKSELKLQADGKWPWPSGISGASPPDPGVPYVTIKPFQGRWGDPYVNFSQTYQSQPGDAYIFPLPPAVNAELP